MVTAFPIIAQEEPARIRGRVTTLFGQPLEGAHVSFFQLQGIQGSSPSEQLIQQTFTNTNGEYQVNGLPAGQYRVEVLLKGYGHTEVWRFYLWRGASRVLDVGIPMGMLDHISQMEIRGSVLRTKNEILKDATVTLTSVYNPSESQQVRSDDQGKYILLLMQEGDYLIHVSKPGYEVVSKTISIRSGERKTADFSLTPMQPKKRLERTRR
jgi:hypothetical protein